MQTIDFTENPNGKLFPDMFSFVRLHDEKKFYVGNDLEAMYKNMPLGYVQVVAVRAFRYVQIRDVLSFLETGKPANYLAAIIKRRYASKEELRPDTLLDHVVVKYTKRNIETQNTMLTDWWSSKTEAA